MLKKTENKKTVFCAMSGGVDSSVAALLLKNQGYDVVGVFMRCYNLDGCSERDAVDARRVAEKLKIPFYIWDFEKEYKKKVVEYMIDGYRKGITPNPDVMCNKEIKFGLFLKKAKSLGAEFIATGHYVRLRNTNKYENTKSNSYFRKNFVFRSLNEAKDKNKDQSYFLWTLTQEQLKHCLFPIGDYLKSEVREIARKAGLPTAEKKDSQGICFLGRVRLGDFLKNYIKPKVGQVRLALSNGEYKAIGQHKGAQFYTIGQRHIGIMNYELGIRGRHETKPHYVAERNIKTNTLVVVEGDKNPALYRKEIELKDLNFINPDIFSNSLPAGRQDANKRMEVLARVRYRQPLIKANLVKLPSLREVSRRETITNYQLLFSEPIKFVASGQSAVFYLPAEARRAKAGDEKGPADAKSLAGMEMLGGGVIM